MIEESTGESNDKLKLVGHAYEFGPFRLGIAHVRQGEVYAPEE